MDVTTEIRCFKWILHDQRCLSCGLKSASSFSQQNNVIVCVLSCSIQYSQDYLMNKLQQTQSTLSAVTEASNITSENDY